MTNPRRTIEEILSCDLDDFEEVESSVAVVSHADTMRLLAICSKALGSADTAMVEAVRVGCVKVLVALLPHSREVIEAVLMERSEHSYEVHFSLFCFLSEVPCHERLEPSAPFVLSRVRAYLRDVPTENAHAAWMAGDMIGDHWPDSDEATDVLLETLNLARFPAGRHSALHGISHLLSRDGLSAECESRLVSSLMAIVRAEPDSELGRGARHVLNGFGCG